MHNTDFLSIIYILPIYPSHTNHYCCLYLPILLNYHFHSFHISFYSILLYPIYDPLNPALNNLTPSSSPCFFYHALISHLRYSLLILKIYFPSLHYSFQAVLYAYLAKLFLQYFFDFHIYFMIFDPEILCEVDDIHCASYAFVFDHFIYE
jgi:hypothetical protein